ncbi:MAG: hypothetical protein WAO10_02155 [Candidatus Sulfotelmatobacter sp.]
MSASTVTTPADTPTESIAPWWHTVLVLVPLAIGSVASAYQHGLESLHVPGLGSRFSSYVTVLLEEWFVVFLIWLALRRRGLSISSLVSGHWQTLGAFFRDLGLGVGFLVIEIPLSGLLSYLLGDSKGSTVNFTPQTGSSLSHGSDSLPRPAFVKSLSSVDISTANSTRGPAATHSPSSFKAWPLASSTVTTTTKLWA